MVCELEISLLLVGQLKKWCVKQGYHPFELTESSKLYEKYEYHHYKWMS